jgi:multidrug resistance protein
MTTNGARRPSAATATPAAPARISRSVLLPIFLVVFVDFTGFGLILPSLPFWARRLGANPAEIGLALTVYALAQFLFTPVLGALSDRYGRRPIILASLCIEALGFALTALSGSLLTLLCARFLAGVGASSIGSAQAVVADVTTAKTRARGMGMIGAAIGLGFVVGPALGGILATWGLTAPFWAAMGVALVNIFLVVGLLPETQHTAAGGATSWGMRGRRLLRRSQWSVLRKPDGVRIITATLLFTLAFSGMEAVFPLLTLQQFRWGATQNGYLFTYIGVLVVVMQGGLVGRLVARLGERTLLLTGLVLLATGLLLLPLSRTLPLVLLSLALLSIGEGAVTPTSTALLSLVSPSQKQGETLGVGQGVASLGRIFGPLAAGWLFTALGPGAPFALGGTLTLLALLAVPPKSASRPSTTTPSNLCERRSRTHWRKNATQPAQRRGPSKTALG